MGLAVTDSPASSGTTRLTFSKSDGIDVSLEHSQLEEIEFSEYSDVNLISQAMTTLFNLFQSGGQLPDADSNPQEEAPMNKEQFGQIESTLTSIVQQQEKQQTQLNEFSSTLTTFSKQQAPQESDEQTPPKSNEQTSSEQTTPEGDDKQFSALSAQIQTVLDGQKNLQTQFNALKQEVPGQENDGEGADTTVETF
jgi:chromosome segregation ATPase